MPDTTETWIDFRSKFIEVVEERRKAPRIELHFPVRIEGVEGPQPATNLSMGGAFVELEHASAFKEGQAIRLTMSLPNESEPVKAKAEVIHIQGTGIGFKFVDLEPMAQHLVQLCIDNFKDTVPLK
ncbi:MAG: PilZ domain-containing protein [Deltaproteobacteria bacterium]|nr:PilZ domain-containing protein [Deltaproteobacteria bacterium]